MGYLEGVLNFYRKSFERICFEVFWYESSQTLYGRRDGARPVSQAKIKKIWGNIQLKNNDGFVQFVFFVVSIPCDTRHAASLRRYIFLR